MLPALKRLDKCGKKGRTEWVRTALETCVGVLIILKWFFKIGFCRCW